MPETNTIDREFFGDTYWSDSAIEENIGTGLSMVESSEAYRALAWDSWDNRCQVLADRLDVDASKLAAYLMGLVKKAPDLNGNGWDYRQELASHIVTGLLARVESIKGRWELIKLEAAGEYKTWYRGYSQRITANKQIQSVSLEREKWLESGSIDVGAELVAIDHETSLDVMETFRTLPDRVRDIIERKLAGVTLLASERKHLSRWLQNTKRVASNGEILRARLMGKPGAYTLEFGKAAR